MLSQIITPSRTLIDSIFSNNIEEGLNLGNINSTLSDHYATFTFRKSIEVFSVQ